MSPVPLISLMRSFLKVTELENKKLSLERREKLQELAWASSMTKGSTLPLKQELVWVFLCLETGSPERVLPTSLQSRPSQEPACGVPVSRKEVKRASWSVCSPSRARFSHSSLSINP
jgi:hypothetical protein